MELLKKVFLWLLLLVSTNTVFATGVGVFFMEDPQDETLFILAADAHPRGYDDTKKQAQDLARIIDGYKVGVDCSVEGFMRRDYGKHAQLINAIEKEINDTDGFLGHCRIEMRKRGSDCAVDGRELVEMSFALPKNVSVYDAFVDVRKTLLEIESYDDGKQLNAYYKEAVVRMRNNLSSIESTALKLGYDLRRCSMGQLYTDQRMGSQSLKGLVYGEDSPVHESNAGLDCINDQINSVCELQDVITLHKMYQAKKIGKKVLVVAAGYTHIYHLVHILEKIGCKKLYAEGALNTKQADMSTGMMLVRDGDRIMRIPYKNEIDIAKAFEKFCSLFPGWDPNKDKKKITAPYLFSWLGVGIIKKSNTYDWRWRWSHRGSPNNNRANSLSFAKPYVQDAMMKGLLPRMLRFIKR